MYRNAYQHGMLTVFYSCGSNPLNIWESHVKDGYITRFLDQDIKSMVVEIGGTNVSTTYMICPKGKQVLGISMPFLVMIVKNLKKYFTFEVTILDETGARRRFRVSNFQSNTQILPMCTVMPIGLSDGWNQIQFNLSEFTRRAYKKQFIEVQKLKINANIRIRRIYFAEKLMPEDELPPEYKLYFPLASKGAKGKKQKEAEDKKVTEPVPAEAPAAPVKVEEPQPEEVKTEVAKEGSKASVHSVKKETSKMVSRSVMEEIPEGEAPPEVAAEEGAEGAEGAATEGEGDVTEGAAEGASEAQAPEQPAEEAPADEAAPAPEEEPPAPAPEAEAAPAE